MLQGPWNVQIPSIIDDEYLLRKAQDFSPQISRLECISLFIPYNYLILWRRYSPYFTSAVAGHMHRRNSIVIFGIGRILARSLK
jgi:hypothetical protein